MSLEPTEVFGIVGGTGGIGALLWKIFDWSVARNVKQADEANAARDLVIKELELKCAALKEDNTAMKHQVGTMTSAISDVRLLLERVGEDVERSRDKQATFYREELKKVEHDLRQEITRSGGAEAIMMVKKLEADLFEPRVSKPRKR